MLSLSVPEREADEIKQIVHSDQDREREREKEIKVQGTVTNSAGLWEYNPQSLYQTITSFILINKTLLVDDFSFTTLER